MTAVVRHGGDLEGATRCWGNHAWTDFSSNICPLGVPEPVRRRLIDGLASDLVVYPDPQNRRLREALARRFDARPENILPGCGASELIWALGLILPGPVLLPRPAFVDYARATARRDVEIRPFDLRPNEGFRLDGARLSAALAPCRSVILGNPNNPTSVLTPPEELVDALSSWLEEGGVAVLDESFIELTDGGLVNSCWPLLRDRPNVLILRSFTKSLALPGLRLGWAMGEPGTLDRLAALLPDWSVGGSAQGLADCLDDLGDYECRRTEWLTRERAFLSRELAALPDVTVFRPAANFLLVRLESISGLRMAERLARRDILVRRCGDFPGLGEDYLRLAVKDHEANQRLVVAMAAALEERD